MDKKEIGYAEAVAEVEKILAEIASRGMDVDALAAKVERASYLLGICRERLRKAEEGVEKVLGTKE